jgi:phosphatidylglycerophosphate synthase
MPREYDRPEMVVCPEPEEAAPAPAVPASLAARARKERAHREFLTQTVFAPLGRVVVAMLIPLRVSPIAVVVANGVAGLVAAALIARGNLVPGALFLQLKSILDNADGQLARVTGRTSALGRYLDTEVDLVANATLFAALAYESGSLALVVAGFVAVTLVLSADFNADVLYRRARGADIVTEPSADAEGRVARFLARVYRVVYGLQDRAVQGISRRRLERVLAGVSDGERRERVTLAYHDRSTVVLLSNLGLTTQFALLGVALVLGHPMAYVWIPIGAVALLPVLQLRREHIARQLARG